jgi:hypothetical protein
MGYIMSENNKRDFTRVNLEFEAKIIFNNKAIEGKINDLSIKGMFFETEHELPENEILDIVLKIKNIGEGLVLKLKGKPVRKTDKGIAIYFEKIDADSFQRLENIVAYNFGDKDKIDQEFKDYISKKLNQE